MGYSKGHTPWNRSRKGATEKGQTVKQSRKQASKESGKDTGKVGDK